MMYRYEYFIKKKKNTKYKEQIKNSLGLIFRMDKKNIYI